MNTLIAHRQTMFIKGRFNTSDSASCKYMKATDYCQKQTMSYIQTCNDIAYREQERDAEHRWGKEQGEAEQARELEQKSREGKLGWLDAYNYSELTDTSKPR